MDRSTIKPGDKLRVTQDHVAYGGVRYKVGDEVTARAYGRSGIAAIEDGSEDVAVTGEHRQKDYADARYLEPVTTENAASKHCGTVPLTAITAATTLLGGPGRDLDIDAVLRLAAVIEVDAGVGAAAESAGTPLGDTARDEHMGLRVRQARVGLPNEEYSDHATAATVGREGKVSHVDDNDDTLFVDWDDATYNWVPVRVLDRI